MGSGVSTPSPQQNQAQRDASRDSAPYASEVFSLQSVHDRVVAQSPKAAALGGPQVPPLDAFVTLDNLPECLSDVHNGMPTVFQRAPMRLLKIGHMLKWSHLKVYEDVDHETECLTLPYISAGDDVWQRVAAVSWRWSEAKPALYKQRFSPMSATQFAELKSLLQFAADRGIEYAWIDWSCVPQYTADALTEVHRSKAYFARARTLRVIPSFRTLPTDGPMRLVLIKASKVLSKRSEDTGSLRCGLAAAIIAGILTKNMVARREYFARAWTLAERMARFGRNEGPCQWLSLESWLGMVVDAMLDEVATGGGGTAAATAASVIHRRMLGSKASSILDAILEPLAAAARVGGVRTRACEGLETMVADLLGEAVGVWLSSCLAVEAPTKGWLNTYLGAEAPEGLYQASRQADRVWAIYSYFCWKGNLDQRSAEGLRIALEDLVEIAGGEYGPRVLWRMFAQLGIEAAPIEKQQQQQQAQQPEAAESDAQAAGAAGRISGSGGGLIAGPGALSRQASGTAAGSSAGTSAAVQELFRTGSQVTVTKLLPAIDSVKCGQPQPLQQPRSHQQGGSGGAAVPEPDAAALLGTCGVVQGIDKDGNVRAQMDVTGTSLAWSPADLQMEGAQKVSPLLPSEGSRIEVWIPRLDDVNES